MFEIISGHSDDLPTRRLQNLSGILIRHSLAGRLQVHRFSVIYLYLSLNSDRQSVFHPIATSPPEEPRSLKALVWLKPFESVVLHRSYPVRKVSTLFSS